MYGFTAEIFVGAKKNVNTTLLKSHHINANINIDPGDFHRKRLDSSTICVSTNYIFYIQIAHYSCSPECFRQLPKPFYSTYPLLANDFQNEFSGFAT